MCLPHHSQEDKTLPSQTYFAALPFATALLKSSDEDCVVSGDFDRDPDLKGISDVRETPKGTLM